MLKKLLKILPVFIILFSTKTFALTYTSPGHCRKWEIYFNLTQSFSIEKMLDISDIKVKFTQDDVYFYFDINADVSLGTEAKNKLIDESSYWFCSSPYDGKTFRSGDIYPYLYGSNNFTNKTIYRYTEIHTNNAGRYWSNYEYITVNGNTIATLDYKDSFKEKKDSYYNTWYSTYFYIPHPLSDYCWFGYGNKFNPSTGNMDLYFPSATEVLPSHDGFSLLSRSCSIKEKKMSGNYVSECTYQIYSKLRMEKTKFNRYRYLAFGGPLYIGYDGGNDLFVGLKVCCGSSNVYDLGSYTNCNHDWYYIYDEELGTHSKICKSCEWCITKEHEFVYEYDGFKNNMCECGCTKQVNTHFYINDDRTKEEHFVHNSNTNEEYAKYIEKKGYRFLYYEKYEKQPASTSNAIYSTNSTALKNVLIATISTASSIDGKVEYRSLSYKAISEEMRFKINYYATNGYFENGKRNISKEYTYWGIKNLEKLHDIRDELNYFAYWQYGDKKINSIEDIRKCIVDQDMTFNLYAIYNRLQYGGSERTSEGGVPRAGGGFNNIKEYKSKVAESDFGFEKVAEIKTSNQAVFKVNENEKNKKAEKNVYAMTKTDIIDLCKCLGLNPATISNVSTEYKYKINGDNLLMKILYLFLKYKLLVAVFIIVFVVIYLVLW